jgi:hypothetical protein
MTPVDDQLDPRPDRSAAADPSSRLTAIDTALGQNEIREAALPRAPGISGPRGRRANVRRRGWLVRRMLAVPEVTAPHG